MNRLEYIDNIKALAILMVIFLHSYSVVLYDWGQISAFDFLFSLLNNSFVRSCVPLFLMVSGVTALGKKYDVGSFFYKKICIRLLLPFVFWWLFYCLFVQGRFINPMSLGDICYHFYFVGVIVTCYLLYPIVTPFVQQATPIACFYFSLFWLASITLQKIYPEFTLFSTSGLYSNIGFPVIAFWLSGVKLYGYKKCALIVFILSCVFTFIITGVDSFQSGKLSERYLEYTSINNVISSFALFIYLKESDFKITNCYLKKIRDFLSEHSYAIYFLHPIYLSALYKLHSSLPIVISGYIIFILGTACTALTIFIGLWSAGKIPFLNKIGKSLVG